MTPTACGFIKYSNCPPTQLRSTNDVSPVFQVAIYMGKRDFVDHCDFVDPVGELWLKQGENILSVLDILE